MTCVNISEEANGMTDRMVASLNATRGAKVGPCQKVRSTFLDRTTEQYTTVGIIPEEQLELDARALFLFDGRRS